MTEINLLNNSAPIAKTEGDWPRPIPLVEKSTSTIYPLNALPTIIQNAITGYHQYGQQPLPLIACSALANVSLACQSLANIARDHYLITPVSLYFLTAGGSGERKSAADSVFSNACRRWETAIKNQRAPEILTAKTVHHAWSMEKDGLLTQIKRAIANGDDSHYLKYQLHQVMSQKPEIPIEPMLYFEDATQEALASDLSTGWPSASLWSDEAGIVLGSHSMQGNPLRFMALLNRLWDGKSFTAHRKTSDNYTLENRRLTLNLMMQPLLLQKIANQVSGIGRQSGFLARCLLAHPESAMGTRFYQEPPTSLEFMTGFEDRIRSCLQQTEALTRLGCHNLPTLSLSPEAKHQWILFFNSLETGLKACGQWVDVKDFASKSAENAARLAALFHLFDGSEGSINTTHTEQAIEIVNWHLEEARRILAPSSEHFVHQNAKKLMKWILSKGLQQTTPRLIQQSSPLRYKTQRDRALELLAENHWIRMDKQENQTLIKVNPHALTAWN
ncbi:MAG: DUF3987 domain-containing protein [Gammaproteobacteria bacterium]|nr:DUF3987 domain-containing protein [Gammaproteobacteria bacterium]